MTSLATAPPIGSLDQEPLSVSTDVRLLTSGPRLALFRTETQRLHQLNESAASLWRQLSTGGGGTSLRQALVRGGCTPDAVSDFGDAAIRMWMLKGYVVPTRVIQALEVAPLHVRQLVIAGTPVRITIFPIARPHRDDLALAADSARALDATFSQFRNAALPAGASISKISLVALEGFIFILQGRKPQLAVSAAELMPCLKGMLTHRIAETLQGKVVLHAAHVSKGRQNILLCGAAGAGKSTLSLALCAHGYVYGGDDLVCVNDDGSIEGLPFAASAKAGAWPLLEPFYPNIRQLPLHHRADRKEVRYLLPDRYELPSRRIPKAVVFLDRKSGSKPAFEHVNALDALHQLLDGAHGHSRRLDGTTIQNLTARLAEAHCVKLTYEHLEPALAAIDGLVGA